MIVGDDVSIGISIELSTDQSGRGFVTDGVEETVGGEEGFFAGFDVLDAQAGEEVAVANGFGGNCVPEDGL